MKKINQKKIKEILEIPAISGREFKLSKYLVDFFQKNNLIVEFDNLGSIIATKKSTNKDAKTILFDAHMDEVGFMITDFTSEGLIKFEEHGYIDNVSLVNQRVKVWNKDLTKYYSGVISFNHVSTGYSIKKNVPTIDKMFIDVGATSKEELIKKFNFELGNTITFDTNTEINFNRVITKAADDRIGISLLTDIAEFIKDKEFDYNIVLAATVQEEVGIRGARTTSYKVTPDLVFTIDVSEANDLPGSSYDWGIGKGTFLKHKDALYITPISVVNYLRNIIKKNKISSQDFFSNGGTNSYAYSLTKEGIKVIPIGMLIRNIHTGSIVFDLKDYAETRKLIYSIIEDLTNELIIE